MSASASGITLTVTYPSVTRLGLPIRWEIEVTRLGGFTEPIELHTTFGYLHLFDISNLEPAALGILFLSPFSLQVFEEEAGKRNSSTVRAESNGLFLVQRADAAATLGAS